METNIQAQAHAQAQAQAHAQAQAQAEPNDMDRGKRKIKTGIVVSDKMEKTITVSVQRIVQHPMYKKYLKKYTKLKAHDENSEAHMGDTVEIMETRPLSKSKNWRLVKVLKKKERE